MPRHMTKEMINFLSTHLHNLAWNTRNMPGIDPTITEYRLNIDLTYKPVKQKPNQFGEDKLKGM